MDEKELVETSKKKDAVQRCWVRPALNILRDGLKGEVVVEQREGEKENVVKMKTETNWIRTERHKMNVVKRKMTEMKKTKKEEVK